MDAHQLKLVAVMKIHRVLPAPVLRNWAALAIAAAACSLPAWAGPTAVPFKASLVTEEVLGADPVRCPGTVLVGTTTGKGQASHMGAVTMTAVDCPTLGPGAPTFSNGTLALRAANGDVVNASYHGTLYPVAGVPNLFSIAGNFTVTGGTGRFAAATGGGYLEGTITMDPVLSPGRYEVTGTLSY